VTEQVLPEEVREQVEVWEEAAEEEEWEAIVRAQAREESVSARDAELKHLISRESPVIP